MVTLSRFLSSLGAPAALVAVAILPSCEPSAGSPPSTGGAPLATSGGGPASNGGGSTGGAAASGGENPDGGGRAGGGLGGGANPGSGGRGEAGGSASTAGGSSNTSGGTSAAGGARPSSGCGESTEVTSGPRTVDVDGTLREYILDLPENYDETHPYRLVLGYHGRMYDAEWVANGEAPLTGPYFGMQEAAGGQAVFVATQALSSSWTNEGGRDIAYTQKLIDTLKAELCIDENRVFVSGFSYGAIMTIRIGCELAGVVRAIAPMSGSLTNGCPENAAQVAYWSSHGLQDATIQPAQGEAVRDEFIARNHCQEETQPSSPAGCVEYLGCDAGYPVEWCPFEGEHEPPPFAGQALWAFFSQF